MEDITAHLLLDTILPVVLALVASSGFWAYIMYRLEKRDNISEQRKLQTDLLIGLAHDRVVYLGLKYIKRGWITADEFENLSVYLYTPYKAMGGNGSANRIMAEVEKLRIVVNGNYNAQTEKE